MRVRASNLLIKKLSELVKSRCDLFLVLLLFYVLKTVVKFRFWNLHDIFDAAHVVLSINLSCFYRREQSETFFNLHRPILFIIFWVERKFLLRLSSNMYICHSIRWFVLYLTKEFMNFPWIFFAFPHTFGFRLSKEMVIWNNFVNHWLKLLHNILIFVICLLFFLLIICFLFIKENFLAVDFIV